MNSEGNIISIITIFAILQFFCNTPTDRTEETQCIQVTYFLLYAQVVLKYQ